MPAKIKILGPDNIWKYKEVIPKEYITSALYPVVVIESMGNVGLFTDVRQDEQGFANEEMRNFGLLTNILKETTIVPTKISYDWPAEEFTNFGLLTNIAKETTVVPTKVPYEQVELFTNHGLLTNVLKEEVDGGTPLLYTQWPADEITNYGILTSIVKEIA